MSHDPPAVGQEGSSTGARADGVTVLLDDRLLGVLEKVQLLQDGLAALLLLKTGYVRLSDTARGLYWLGVFELVIGVATAVFVVRDLRGKEKEGRIGWVSLLTGLTLMVESLVATAQGHKLLRPALVMGITVILVGLFNQRLAGWRTRMRRIELRDDGLSMRASKLRKFHVGTDEITRLVVKPDAILIEATTARPRRIGLRRYANREEIRAAILEWARTHGKEVRSMSLPSTEDPA